MHNRGLRCVLWGMTGFVLGAVATFFGGLAAGEMIGISQAEGAFVMQVAFFWTPVGAIAGALIGVFLARRS